MSRHDRRDGNTMESPNYSWIVLLCILSGCKTTTLPFSGLSSGSQPNIDAGEPSTVAWAAHENAPNIVDFARHSTSTANSKVEPAGLVQPAPQPAEPIAVPTAKPQTESSPPLSLEQLEEIAMSSNPTLAEAQAKINALRGRWVQAGLPPNTVLGYSGQQLGSHGQAEQNGVYISQEFVRGHKLRLSRAVVDQEIAVAERNLEMQRLRVQTDVRLGYYEVLVAQRRVELAEEIAQNSVEVTKAANALFNVKEASQADVLRAQLEFQGNQVALKIARNQLAAGWSKLTTVLGVPDMPQQKLIGDLKNPNLGIVRSDVLNHIMADSPEYHAALFNVERSQVAIARAVAEGVPNIDVQGVIQQDNATGSSNGMLQVSMPIPWLNYNQGEVREAHADLAAAQFAVGRVELSLQRRLTEVFQRYASARDQVLDYSMKDGILDNAEKTLELIRAGYRAGQFGYLDMVTAQRSFAQTNLAYVEAIGELWEAKVEIEGLLLKGSLDNPPASP